MRLVQLFISLCVDSYIVFYATVEDPGEAALLAALERSKNGATSLKEAGKEIQKFVSVTLDNICSMFGLLIALPCYIAANIAIAILWVLCQLSNVLVEILEHVVFEKTNFASDDMVSLS